MTANNNLLAQLPTIAMEADQYAILLSAKSFRSRLLEEIQKATTRIYLVALYLEDDEAGREVLTALYEAKQRCPSLDVVVCVDWHRAQRGLIGAGKTLGNATLYKEYAQKYTHPISILGVPVRGKEVFGVLHLKGFIIDNTVIYSGASLNNIYLHFNDRYRFDRYHVITEVTLADSMTRYVQQHIISNPAVHSLTQEACPSTKSLKQVIKKFRASLSKSSYELPTTVASSSQISVTPMVGIGKHHNELNLNIIKLIAAAETEILILTPYFNFPKSITKEINKALRRGVKIDIVVGDKTANDFYIAPEEPFKTIAGLPYLYETNLRKFVKSHEEYVASEALSIHLWKHENNSFHLKGMWIDKKNMLITGHNFNPRAWNLDLENGLLVQDPNQALLGQFNVEAEAILHHTHLVTTYAQIEKISDYPLPVQKLLKRVKRTKVDKLLKHIL